MTMTGRTYQFGLEDEARRPIGIFESYRRGWRIGDWLLTREGRRLQIVGTLPPPPQDDATHLCEIWLVEPA